MKQQKSLIPLNQIISTMSSQDKLYSTLVSLLKRTNQIPIKSKNNKIAFDWEKFISFSPKLRLQTLVNVINNQVVYGRRLDRKNYNFFIGFLIFSIQQYDIKATTTSSIMLLTQSDSVELKNTITRFVKAQQRENGYFGYLNPLLSEINRESVTEFVNTTTAYLMLLNSYLKK